MIEVLLLNDRVYSSRRLTISLSFEKSKLFISTGHFLKGNFEKYTVSDSRYYVSVFLLWKMSMRQNCEV